MAEYAHLYTNQTFSPLKLDAMQQAAELNAVVAVVYANLTPRTWPCRACDSRGRSCFHTEAHRWASLLMSTPWALRSCFASSPTARRTRGPNQSGDLSLAWWSRNGRGHLVIGHVPEERAVALAQMIEKRV
jgi:hypothetical protein